MSPASGRPAKGNPFYLLSALSMLAGCYTLSHALALQPGQADKLALLLGTVNLYELIVIGLALALLERRDGSRDARVLLGLEALFLVDATFLSAEFFAISRKAGLVAMATGLGFAVLKLWLLRGALRRRLSIAPFALLPQLAAILAVPWLMSELAAARWLSPGVAYALWWAAALGLLLQPPLTGGKTAGDVGTPLWWRLAPPLSLILHLAATGWVHGVAPHLAYLAPLLVAASGLAIRSDLPWVSLPARLVLPGIAAVLSLAPSPELVVGIGEVTVSPLRAVLLASALIYAFGWHTDRDRRFAHAATLCLAAGLLGHSPSTIVAPLKKALRLVIPRSALQWGLTAVAAAFAMLGLGAMRSFRSPLSQTRVLVRPPRG
jgi:hypothetical protein